MSNKNDNQIINTLNKHGGVLEKIEKQLEKQEKILKEHSGILRKHGDTLERHTQMLVQHEYDIKEIKENMMTKADKDEILSVITEFAGRTHSNEEQITIGAHQLRRTNDKVDKIEADVKRIKPLVGLR